MTTLTKKLMLAAMAATMIAATPAMANSYRHTTGMQSGPMASEGYVAGDAGYGAYAAAPAVPGEYGTVQTGGAGVISYDRYAGWDPDPAIRLMLKRDANGKDAP